MASFKLFCEKMGLWRWKLGRQGTEYSKFLLIASYWPLPFDLYIIRYDVGSFIPLHTDKVASGSHYRLNIILKEPKKGGHFYCKNVIFATHRIKFFRPDLYEHAVDVVEGSPRYVLSLGFVLSSKIKTSPAH
jgi:hypothetical protein